MDSITLSNHSLICELNKFDCSICKLWPALSNTANVALWKLSRISKAFLYPTTESCFPSRNTLGWLNTTLSKLKENPYFFWTLVKNSWSAILQPAKTSFEYRFQLYSSRMTWFELKFSTSSFVKLVKNSVSEYIIVCSGSHSKYEHD